MYILCLILALLAPLVMIGVGLKWYLNPPAFKEGKLAYRTPATEKSSEVWFFAHLHCSKLWVRFGAILLVLTVILMVALRASYQKFFLWLLCGQMLVLCVTLLIIEYLIRGLFDENGLRIR